MSNSSGSNNRRVKPLQHQRQVANENEQMLRDLERGLEHDEREEEKMKENIKQLITSGQKTRANREAEKLVLLRERITAKKQDVKLLSRSVTNFSAGVNRIDVMQRVSEMGHEKARLKEGMDWATALATTDESTALDEGLDDWMKSAGINEESEARDQAESKRLIEELMQEASEPQPARMPVQSQVRVAQLANNNNNNTNASPHQTQSRSKYGKMKELFDDTY
jgi:hypothetical protein